MAFQGVRSDSIECQLEFPVSTVLLKSQKYAEASIASPATHGFCPESFALAASHSDFIDIRVPATLRIMLDLLEECSKCHLEQYHANLHRENGVSQG
jgi:hypothetical protein